MSERNESNFFTIFFFSKKNSATWLFFLRKNSNRHRKAKRTTVVTLLGFLFSPKNDICCLQSSSPALPALSRTGVLSSSGIKKNSNSKPFFLLRNLFFVSLLLLFSDQRFRATTPFRSFFFLLSPDCLES